MRATVTADTFIATGHNLIAVSPLKSTTFRVRWENGDYNIYPEYHTFKTMAILTDVGLMPYVFYNARVHRHFKFGRSRKRDCVKT